MYFIDYLNNIEGEGKRARGKEGVRRVREGRVVPRQATIGSSDDNTETKHGVIPKLVILISAAFGKDWS